MPFLAIGVATALVYALLVAWVPLLPSNLYEPLLDLGKMTGYTWSSALLYVALVSALFALYALGYSLSKRAQPKLTFILAGVFAAEMLFAYPATAADVFGYIAHGRLFAIHGLNPFVSAPSEFIGDPIIPYLAYPEEPSQYGPLWVLLGSGIVLLGHGSLLTEVLAYKVIGVVAHLLGGALVYITARHLAPPPQARASAYVFLWNPLLLWEMVANAHNDGLMMLGALAAAWLFVSQRDLLVLPALVAGALVKLPVFALAPLFFIATFRRKAAVAIEGALLALTLAVVVYRPFWDGVQTLTALRRTDLFTASLGSVLRLALEPALGLDTASSVARAISLAMFAIVFVLTIVLSVRAPDRRTVLQLGYIAMLAVLLVGTTWFQAWYVVWPLALGAALASRRRHLEVALLSLGGLLQYLVFIYLWVMGVFPGEETLGLQLAAYAAVLGPPILGMVAYASVVSRSLKKKKTCKPS